MLDAYVEAVSRGNIKPSPGHSVRDHLLNNDQQFVTLFLPTNAAMRRVSQYERERYLSMERGNDPLLLQKVIRYSDVVELF